MNDPATIQTYNTESYASDYIPGKSIYQSDARLFYRAGHAYEPVNTIASGEVKSGVLHLVCLLSSGQNAHLSLELYQQHVLRIKFAQEQVKFDETSEMLMPIQGKPSAQWKETAQGWTLTFDDKTLHVSRDPFNLWVEDATGKRVFELETEKIAGHFVSPPLGIRRHGANNWPFMSFRMHNKAHFYGLGEKWNKVEKTSTRATIWAADTCGSNTTDMCYKSLPLLYSTRGWGLMLHSGFRSYWEVGTFCYHAGAVMSEDNKLDLFLFFAPSLKGLIGKYTDLTGKPSSIPRWALGVWMSRCAYWKWDQIKEVTERLRKEKFPCDVVHFDPMWMKTHYYFKIGVDACDFVWNETNFANHKDFLATLHANGFDSCFWINPYLPEGEPVYEEAKAKGYLARSVKGGLARLEYGNPVGIIDLLNPEARKWWKGFLHQLVAEGASVFKPDYGDRVAEDALFYNGRTGLEMHNMFMFEYTRAPFEVIEEAKGKGKGIVWRRSGFLGSQRYPGCWAGDTQVTWEAMRCCLHGGLSAGYAADAFWSHDIGGFCGDKPSDEMYIRWAQLGMFTALTRFHGTSPREPWEYGTNALQIVGDYARLRYSLMPWWLSLAEEAAATGMPLMRHMRLEFENEYNVDGLDDQYMLGGDMLVLPVMEPGATQVSGYFPEAGRTWYSLDNCGETLQGGTSHTVAAPLEKMPVYVRGGAIIPRYTHAPQHLKEPSPSAIDLCVYAGQSDRKITWAEDMGQVTISYQADAQGKGTIKIDPVKLQVTLKLIGFAKPTVTVNGKPASIKSCNCGGCVVTVDAAAGATIEIK